VIGDWRLVIEDLGLVDEKNILVRQSDRGTRIIVSEAAEG